MLNPYDKIANDMKCIKNCKCIPLIVGPEGPEGPKGEADTIVVRDTITGEAGSFANVIDNYNEGVHTLDFVIPRGNAGPTLIKTAYIVTFNDGTSADGIPVDSLDRIPFDRVELDNNNLVTVDFVEQTIKFNIAGYYKVSFSVSAYPKVNAVDFDPTRDIVSVGFRQTNTDNVYVGVGQWVYNGEPVVLTATGIISVPNPNNLYELVNLGKETIYLESPDLKDIASSSYFSNSLVTLVIEYLGR